MCQGRNNQKSKKLNPSENYKDWFIKQNFRLMKKLKDYLMGKVDEYYKNYKNINENKSNVRYTKTFSNYEAHNTKPEFKTESKKNALSVVDLWYEC